MTGAILQPGYLPWAGFFDLLFQSDVFVIYDDVQYTRRDWRNRNRIKFGDKIHTLTVPVNTAGTSREDLKINEALISYGFDWQKNHIETIKHAYSKTEWFSKYGPGLSEILSKKPRLLIDLLMPIIYWAAGILEIERKIVFSSELNIDRNFKKSDRLIAICKELGIDSYLTGDAARDYISVEQFKQDDISVYFHDYKHPVYRQLGKEFVSHLSIIDAIFNCGPEAKLLFEKREF
ncbi:MAG: WbqC family protein [Candidatus Portnoybacteria bacterium]|nr:WbqC family protein [Candidatus Portnoybacteria bacterium]MDD4982472.1 WbqC family protein [Candidatus Portnoybacteria bacterium]